jgi:hypothetical protein
MSSDHSLDRLDRIHDILNRVHAQLESLRVMMTAQIEANRDHEDRLRSLERWKHTLTPFLAGGTFLLGACSSLILEKLF